MCGGAGVTTLFHYDGARLIAEYDDAGAVLRRYVHGPGVDEPLVWYEGTGTADPRWLIADMQGSIIATTSANGAATTLAYGPYREPAAWTGPGGAMLSRFRYTGQAALPELALYHYKARVYDPRLGRFLQTDPIGYEDDLNLYAYGGNDPLNLSDPSGECATSEGPNGEQRNVGICSTNKDMQATIDSMIADPDSSLGKVEANAVAKGAIISVQVRVNDPDVKVANTATGFFGDQPAAIVKMDIGERVEVEGVNTITGAPETRVLTDQEVLEHEVGGHAGGYVETGAPSTGEIGPISLENVYREKKGIPFRRTSHNGRVTPRSPVGIDK